MTFFYYTYLFIIGTLFGSFASVVIDRLKNKKSGIIAGRSECPKCRHALSPFDLIPVFSFLSTKGKCRYCKTKISYLYPILEITTGILFVLSSFFLIDMNQIFAGNIMEIYKLLFFLAFSFGTIVYVFYDILYLEIPDSILAFLIGITFFTLGLQSLFPHFQILHTLPNDNKLLSLNEIFTLVGLGVTMISIFYFIMLKGLKEIYDITLLIFIIVLFGVTKYSLGIDIEQTAMGSALLGSLCIFLFLFLQILVSGGAWMGGGDLRIAILMGLVVGVQYSFPSVMISYLSGSIVGIVLILYTKTRDYYQAQKNIIGKIKKILGIRESKIQIDTKMPFGPFLAIGILATLFYSEAINELIKKYF